MITTNKPELQKQYNIMYLTSRSLSIIILILVAGVGGALSIYSTIVLASPLTGAMYGVVVTAALAGLAFIDDIKTRKKK